MGVKAVVFDLDNTLYDYDSCNREAEKRLFEKIALKLGINEAEAQAFLKRAKTNVKERLGGNVAASHNRLLYMQDICEQAGVNPLEYAMEFYDVYWNTMLELMKPYDYVLPLFDKLKGRGVMIGILTDLTAHIQYRKISVLGLSEKIDHLTTSEEAGEEKPSSKGFLLMLEKMNLEPGEVLMVGDSITKDTDGAQAVGMQALLFTGQNTIEKEILDRI